MAASSDPAPAPSWVFGDEPEPDFVKAWLCLDYGDDRARIVPVLETWHDQAVTLLSGLVQPAGSAKPKLRRSGYLEDINGQGRKIRPRKWTDGIGDDYLQLTWSWYDTSPASPVSDMQVHVFRFVNRRHVMLSVSARMEGRSGQLPLVLPPLLEFLRVVAEAADPAYGEVVVNGASIAPATMLDAALRRGQDTSAEDSRTYLRGYEWMTVCPKELVAKVGGLDRLRSSEAFIEVTPLDGGAAVLRATEDPAAYGPDRVRAVFSTLAPVLPPGQPRAVPGYDLSRLVLADASEHAGGAAPPSLGPGLPDADAPESLAAQQFVIESMGKDWFFERADGTQGVTPEGRQRAEELLRQSRDAQQP